MTCYVADCDVDGKNFDCYLLSQTHPGTWSVHELRSETREHLRETAVQLQSAYLQEPDDVQHGLFSYKINLGSLLPDLDLFWCECRYIFSWHSKRGTTALCRKIQRQYKNRVKDGCHQNEIVIEFQMPNTKLPGSGIAAPQTISIGLSRTDRRDEHAESNNHYA